MCSRSHQPLLFHDTSKGDSYSRPPPKMADVVANAENSRSVEKLLAKEFLSLSFRDRNAISEEMHGVSCMLVEENPEMINESLVKLDYEISLIPSKYKKMYELCKNRYGNRTSSEPGGSYVNDVNFRLRFLRSEVFNATHAASKLTGFLNVVVDLFGDYALQRPIRLSDFEEDELQVFRMGNQQLLPFRDRSGRRIITGVEGLAMQFEEALRFKILYYLTWVAGEDFETQLKGVIVIIWPIPSVAMKHMKNNPELIKSNQVRLLGIPIRVCAFHFCIPDNPFAHALKIFAMTLDKKGRSRLKFHVGQDIELLYLVKGYGIPVDHIPLTGTGNVKTLNLKVWMKLRTRLEDVKGESGSNIIECPGSKDVLFRPSKMIKGHPGNVKFHSLIETYHEQGLGITAASKKIIADVLEWNGRILVWEKRGWWAKTTDSSQMQFKVSVSYRDYKKKNRIKTKIYDSSTYLFKGLDAKKRKRIEPEAVLS